MLSVKKPAILATLLTISIILMLYSASFVSAQIVGRLLSNGNMNILVQVKLAIKYPVLSKQAMVDTFLEALVTPTVVGKHCQAQ